MSVITYHEVSGDDIFDRLVEEGVIHERDLYSPRRDRSVSFDYVFDYKKCDEATITEVEERDARRVEYWRNWVENNESMTPEEKTRALARNDKASDDIYYMPVSKTKSGGVSWMLNYAMDDMPLMAISRRYPDEMFDYYQVTENHLDVSCKVKNGAQVTEDGRTYNEMISYVSTNLIREMDENTVSVSLYLDSSDKRPAIMYCNKADVIPVNYHILDDRDNYRHVVIRDKDKEIPVYRVLENGTRSKENWSVSDIKGAVKRSKEEYKKSLRRAEANVDAEADKPVEQQDLEVL